MINSVVLVGRLTRDIELRKTQSGLSVASFTVACDRRLSQEQRNNNEQSADFINCVAWRGSADFLGSYAHKGDTVGVEGRIQTRNYDRDGQRVYVTEVLANSVNLLHSKQTAQPQEQASYKPQPTQGPKPQQMSDFDYLPNVEVSSDDLPF
nr:MAG TPA: Single strand binding protein [Caudoviricetes sp.]